MQGYSELRTGLGGQRKERMSVFLGLAGECPTPAQLSRNVSRVQRTLGNYVSDYLHMQPLHSIPTRGKDRLRRSTQKVGDESSPGLAAPYQG